jgi:hypothetical protein
MGFNPAFKVLTAFSSICPNCSLKRFPTPCKISVSLYLIKFVDAKEAIEGSCCFPGLPISI